MMRIFFIYAPKVLLSDILEGFYFLPWWYSRGARYILSKLTGVVVQKERLLALGTWLKNIYRPLSDKYNFWGMMVGFGLRLGQIIARSMVLLLWLLVVVIWCGVYFLAPLVVIWQIIYQLI